MEKLMQRVCEEFRIPGEFLSYEEIKMGNVNNTYRVTYRQEDGTPKSYVLQKVNTYVFRNPEQVMENIDRVTEHIRAKTPGRISLHFHHTRDRKNYINNENGFWRLFNYIPSVTYNHCEDLEVVRHAGEAFGEFQTMLADFDATLLHETIPNFHNTVARYDTLLADVQKDPCGKVGEVVEEIEWLMGVKKQACALTELYGEGKLPLRVTHNDTKINNVLFEKEGNQPIAVIDLDTVMPGLIGHDFGDAIRFAANKVEEDSPDAAQAGVDLDVFREFTEGFLLRTASKLTDTEIDTLALSSFCLTVELATRFLDDYILGSPYFKTNYPEHNLVRARCQIALAKAMLKHMDAMQAIVNDCVSKYR